MIEFHTVDKFDLHLLELDQNNITLTQNPNGPHFVSYGTSISFEEFEKGNLNDLILELYGPVIFDFISTLNACRKLVIKDIEPLRRSYFWEKQQNGSIFRLNCDGKKLFLSKIDEKQKKEKMSFDLEQALLPLNNKIVLDYFGTEMHQEIIQTIKNILIKRIFDV